MALVQPPPTPPADLPGAADRSEERQTTLDCTINMWNTIDIEPDAASPLINLSEISSMAMVYLKRGDFLMLAPSLGVNAATKHARISERRDGRGYSGNSSEFEEAVLRYNSTIAQLRATRPRPKNLR